MKLSYNVNSMARLMIDNISVYVTKLCTRKLAELQIRSIFCLLSSV